MSLHLAGTYRRTVHASLDRVWENVHDWEHLAHLHDGSFARCELVERGPWGWRAWLTTTGADAAQLIELRADRDAGRYVSTTLEGTGAGSEIRVALFPRAPHVTDVAVEFHLPEDRPERLQALGQAYTQAYARLWDEDEEMMRARERALAVPRPIGGNETIDLGPEDAVRAGLPLLFDLGGRRWRLVEVDGALLAHATVCPHWLGPLDDAPVVDGAVRCPWHGWRFDVASGCRVGAAGPSLPLAPRIDLQGGRVRAAAPHLTTEALSKPGQEHDMTDSNRSEHDIDFPADPPMQPTGNGVTDMEIAKLQAAVDDQVEDPSIETPISDDEPTQA